MAFEIVGSASRRAILTGLTAMALAPGRVLAQTQAEPPEVLEGKTDWTRRLTTPVRINGEGPFRFIIDTGANRSVISDQVARRLNLPEGAATLVHGIAGAVPARTVNVTSFMAGGAAVPIKDIPVLDGAPLGAEGLLGIDAFHNRCVEFDFVRGRVTLSHSIAPNEPSPGSFTVIAETTVRAIQRLGQLTIVDAQAVGRRISCFVDSGAQRSVGNMAMRRLIHTRFGDSGFAPLPIILHGATGQDATGEVAVTPSMRIGHLHFTEFPMPFADLHTFSLWRLNDRPAMMLGMDILARFASVIVDFGEKKVTFKMAMSDRPPLA